MDAVYEFDFAVLDALQKIHSPVLNTIFAFFTYLGEYGALWITIALITVYIKKTRRFGITLGAALVTELTLSEILIKRLVRRERPYTLNPAAETVIPYQNSYSFPSGHTCAAFACATVIFCYNRKLGVIAYVTAVMIGFSRSYFYMHFPTDVLGGALEGLLIGTVWVIVIKKLTGPAQEVTSPETDPETSPDPAPEDQ